MPDYEIVFTRSARKEIEKINLTVANRILRKIESLAVNPRPHGCEKLKGGENLWRIRIGDYRVIYKISDKEKLIDVSIIRHRKEAYR